MSKEGVPIHEFDPKPKTRKNAVNARDCQCSKDADYLYGIAVLLKTGSWIPP